MKHRITIFLAASLLLAACSGSHKEPVSVFVWQRVSVKTDMDSLQRDFHNWKSRGITGVCLDVHGDIDRIEEAARRAHEEGLEYHASKENPASTGLLPSELPVAIHNSLAAGASGICLYNPVRMSPEHWDALEEALKAEAK